MSGLRTQRAASAEQERTRIRVLDPPGAGDDGADVVAGLLAQPKTLPSRYFYDSAGSALFDRICDLPEYYPTRTEEGILRRHAGEIAARAVTDTLVELGSGSARKIRLLIGAFAQNVPAIRYVPIDVSAAAIEGSASDLLAQFPRLRVDGFVATYDRALAALSEAGDRGPVVVLFLGSTIGNFGAEETRAFLASLRDTLRSGDFVLIGTDLRKDPAIIEAAYNDASGVTAEFNRNMLRHLNHLFDGDFVPEQFDHIAFYDRAAHQIEMHLRSRTDRRVRLNALKLDVPFRAGETVRTEISRKFDRGEFADLLRRTGFHVVEQWTDPEAWFALSLARIG